MTTCTCGRPTAGAYFCPACETTFRWALANVAAYTDDLGNVLRKQTRYGNQGASKGSIGKTQPLPIDGRFTATTDVGSQLAYDARATVVAWVRVVQTDQPELAGPTCVDCLHVSCSATRRRRFPADKVTSMVAYLARQFRLITSERWGLEMFDEMLDLERRLAKFVDRPADRWYAGKCSEADEFGICVVELYATADRGTVTCPGCGAVHDVATRRDFLLAEAKDIRVTATEAAAALLAWTDYDGTEKKLIDRIAGWRDDGRLVVADVTSLLGRDRHLYRLGDVQDLVVKAAQHAQSKRLGAAVIAC